MRDFRWLTAAPEEGCKWPYIPINFLGATEAMAPFKKYDLIEDGMLGYPALCLQVIPWKEQKVKLDHKEKDGTKVYVAKAPKVKKEGHWMGFFVTMIFESDTTEHTFDPLFAANEYKVTTPGYVTPNTLPFPDCKNASCTPILK